MSNTVKSLFQYPRLNRRNKTIIEGRQIDKFKDAEGVYNFEEIKIINNRIHIILGEGQKLVGEIKAPEGSRITIITPDNVNVSEVIIKYVNRVISKVYNTAGDTHIEHTCGSFNKNASGISYNLDTLKGNSINMGSSKMSLNTSVQGGGYAMNINSGKEAMNRNIRGDAMNINSLTRSCNEEISGNAFSINTTESNDHTLTRKHSIHINYGAHAMDGMVHSKSRIIKYKNVDLNDIRKLGDFQDIEIPKWIINTLKK